MAYSVFEGNAGEVVHDRKFVFDLLERSDKIFVGGGKYVVYAPDFSPNARFPGYADFACYYHVRVTAPLLIGFIDERGREIEPLFLDRKWVPGRVVQHYRVGPFEVRETRFESEKDCLALDYEITNTSAEPRVIGLVAYASLRMTGDADVLIEDATRAGNYLSALGRVRECERRFPVVQTIGLREADSTAILASEKDHSFPPLRVHHFYEHFAFGKLPETDVTRSFRGKPRWLSMVTVKRVTVPPGRSSRLLAGVAIGASVEETRKALVEVLDGDWNAEDSLGVWRRFFEKVPFFRCSDERFERYYWYRYYGMRLNLLPPGPYGMDHPAVVEGINPGWFRHLIAYSAQVHIREMMWSKDPSIAIGSFLNFFENPKPDGCIRGGLGFDIPDHDGHYLGDWGRNLLDLRVLHPESVLSEKIFPLLRRYVDYMEKERDHDGTGLFEIVNQGETGQEYMQRYLFADPQADTWKPIRLKGIDYNVYAYGMYRCLAELAPSDASKEYYRSKAENLRRLINTRMYSPERRAYVDVAVETLDRSPHIHANSFYPFYTSIPERQHLVVLRETLRDPEKFWTDCPCPSSALDEKESDPFGRWRHLATMSCPWNGRSWLMSSSHVLDALCHAARAMDPTLEKDAVDFFKRFIFMLFLEGDPKRPSSYEYYNPLTGKAPYFRGTEEYMHSYIADLLIRYVGGVWIHEDGTVGVRPLRFGTSFELDEVPIGGNRLRVVGNEEGYRVEFNGKVEFSDWETRKEIRIQ